MIARAALAASLVAVLAAFAAPAPAAAAADAAELIVSVQFRGAFDFCPAGRAAAARLAVRRDARTAAEASRAFATCRAVAATPLQVRVAALGSGAAAIFSARARSGDDARAAYGHARDFALAAAQPLDDFPALTVRSVPETTEDIDDNGHRTSHTDHVTVVERRTNQRSPVAALAADLAALAQAEASPAK